MGLYTKKQYEKELQAVEAASSCISAALAESEYVGRLNPYVDDLVAIAEYFWARCPVTRKKLEAPGPDVKEVATVFYNLYMGKPLKGMCQINGMLMNSARYYETVIERCRRKLKGKLLGTRLILQDNDAKPKCMDQKNHRQPCKCKGLTLARMAEAREAME